MLTHSSLDDIEYSYSTRRSIKTRHRHRHRRRSSKKFINYIDDKCAVCLDDTTTLDTKLFPCGHSFHGQCLIQWVTVQKGRKFNCPLCRQDIAHFIQLTGNQNINQQLIEIWNEQYLYNTSDSLSIPQQQQHEKSNKNIKIQCIETDEPLKNVPDQTDIIKPSEIIKIEPVLSINDIIEPIMDNKTDIVSMESVNDIADNKKSDGAIWKFLWKSPLSVLYQQRNDRYSSFVMFKSLLCSMYHANITYHDDVNEDISNLYLLNKSKTNLPPQTDSANCTDSEEHRQCDRNTEELRSRSSMETEGRYNDLFAFSLLNFESGIIAGLSAGCTTYLLSQQMKRELIGKGSRILNAGSFRSTLYPIVSETVPSVSIFFMSYEHIKKYMFNSNSINNNSYNQLFTERFVSAGIASYFAYFAPNIIRGQLLTNIGGSGLLPLRFASFFGTFEFCKDLININHDEISMFNVASSAAIGGGISHSLYYPLLQYKNMYIMNIESVPISSSTYHGSREAMIRCLYKGWLSSLREFLPSCVVCSCAFEISKRYLNT